ncbi:MAG: NADH:flavin oxidoreductase/NADH oxidase [Spirochaetaceae bacterium]|nr:MAG: NADH:flavin oxidoreductase/NADH oxidase [Spirochaetaceae bacterium]
MNDDAHLFSALTVRGVTIRNRIFVSPMCQYSCVDGDATDWHLVHLGSRAVGGAGLVMAEAAAVSPEGRISWGDLGIWDDRHVDRLRPVARFISEHGAVPAIQLAHAGRKAATRRPWDAPDAPLPADARWETVSATARAFSADSAAPRALSTAETAALPGLFAAAAARSIDAGFTVVEIHAAHGYLLHQYLSPLANDRTDEYGGDFDGRTRLLLETVAAVRDAVGDAIPVFVRISATDWRNDGWSVDDSVRLARLLDHAGVDLVDCSSGGIVPNVPIPVGPGFQTPLAAAVRLQAGIRTGAVGMITAPEQADQIVRTGHADAVLLARELLRDPYWPYHAARRLGHDVPAPPQYQRAW